MLLHNSTISKNLGEFAKFKVLICAEYKSQYENISSSVGFFFYVKLTNMFLSCRGKKDVLCGECNGAGFLGGFLSSFDD